MVATDEDAHCLRCRKPVHLLESNGPPVNINCPMLSSVVLQPEHLLEVPKEPAWRDRDWKKEDPA
jgi:hypothetical protein